MLHGRLPAIVTGIPNVRLAQSLKPASRSAPSSSSSSAQRLFQYYCDQCNIRLPSKTRYQDHMNRHEGRKYHCGFCGKAFNTRERLNYHEKEHKGIFLHRCQYCNRGYNHRGDFRKHLDTHRPGSVWK